MDDAEREQLLDLLAPRDDLSGAYVTFEIAGRMMAITVRQVRRLLDPGQLQRVSDAPGLVCGTVAYGDDILPVLDIARSIRKSVDRPRQREALIVTACIVDGLLESAAILVPWPVGLMRLEGTASGGTLPLRERVDWFPPSLGFTLVAERKVALLDVAALVKGISQVVPSTNGDIN